MTGNLSEKTAPSADETTLHAHALGEELAFSSSPATHPNGDFLYGSPGLTKRELFAAMAMQGIFSHGYTMPNESAEAALYAVRAADCLLQELAK